jgi:hypothetical protein
MTQLLERAFAAASRLPNAEQDAFASLLLAELDSERRWTEAFAATQDQLSTLADEAFREFEAGQTQPMDLKRDFPSAEPPPATAFARTGCAALRGR